MKDGQTQVHLTTKDLGAGFRTNHIAFYTDDVAAFPAAARGEEHPYSDSGRWAMNGWHRNYRYDPEDNVIEVHQDMNASPIIWRTSAMKGA